MKRFIMCCCMCYCAGGLGVSAQSATRYIAEADSGAQLPVSAAVEAGEFIYVAGNAGTDVSGGDIGAQTTRALDHIANALTKAESDLNDIVATQVYLTDAADAPGMDRAYQARFGTNPPARTVIVTPALVGGHVLIEINAIAVRHGVPHHAVLPRGWQPPAGPFSYAEKVGRTLYISGLTARNPMDGSAPPPDNIGLQTKTIMDNIGALLKAAGMDYGGVALARIWISDMKYYQDASAVYRTYFSGDLPARATLQFHMVDPTHLIEISAVAVRGGKRRAIVAGINADGSVAKPSPNFSAGIAAGDRMWISGISAPAGDKVDVASHVREQLARMLRVLKAGGFRADQVVDVKVYLRDVRDMSQYQQLNASYRQVFQKMFPARTTVQAGNVGQSPIEIVMMAAR